MSQQGERATGHEDDWWGQLYDDATGDTGPAPAADSLDDRFASAAGAVGRGTPGDRAEPPQPTEPSPALPEQRGPGRQTAPAPWRAPTAAPAEAAGGTGAEDAPRDDGPVPSGVSGSGRTTASPPNTDLPNTDPPNIDPPNTDPPNAAPPAPGKGAARPGSGDAAAPPGAGEAGDPFGPAEARRSAGQRPGPLPWDPPSARPQGPVTFPLGSSAPEFRAAAPLAGTPTQPSPAAVPLPDRPHAPVPPPPGRSPVDAAQPPGRSPADAPPPPGRSPAHVPPPPAVPPPPGRPPAVPTDAVPPGPAPVAAPPPPGEAPSPARPPAEGAVPRTPAPVDYVGSGPPTYDAEPTALPLADPDALDDLVPDTVLDGARYGALTLRATSVRGDSARFRGEPRRDCLLTARFGTGDQALVLVAMATGARGTPGAHRAAAQLCQWIGRAVGRSHVPLGEDIRAGRRGDLKSGLQRLTDRSLGKLRASAAEQGVDPDEHTATLRCLLLPADPACRTRVFFGVGEGGLFRLRGGEWQDIEPRAAETAGEPVVGFGSLPSETPEGDRLTMDLGITTPPSPFEPAPEPPRDPFRFRASIARPGDTLLLCTSGLADPLRGEPQLAEHLTVRWSTGGPPTLTAFLADIRVRVKGYADDRTAAAVWEA
ncbi:protein phosphatase 2C domain-containing protein [Streptomyces sp. NPDC046931]|uniref:protein phosphatase 2C domain-containing protein n=1 Tax=Streptomyces sp. NPDC046931 TaxID=3154806 RepID=UPI003400D534